MNSYQLLVGAAEADITPPIGITLAGALTRRVSASVLDPLHARAVVLESGGTRVAFVLLDIIALGNEDAAAARQAVAEAADMPVENVCVSCTHTHSGPSTVELFDSPREGEYLATTIPQVAQAARLASERMQPARAAWGNGWEPRAAFNRRRHMRDGSVAMNPGYQNPDIIRPAGPTDPQIPMLMLESTAGEPIAMIANFSLHYIGDHPGDVISADYFGEFANLMKEKKGENFVALLTHGASGDINNCDFVGPPPQYETHEQSRRVAAWIADQVEEQWGKAEFIADAPVGSNQSIYQLRVRKIAGDEIAQAQKDWEDESLPIIERFYGKERLELLKWPDHVPVAILTLRVGDFAAGTMSGEIFCQFGLDLKNASPFPVTALIELANGHGGYTPTRVDYDLGSYETWLARSAFAAPGSGEEMVAVAAMGLRRLVTE